MSGIGSKMLISALVRDKQGAHSSSGSLLSVSSEADSSVGSVQPGKAPSFRERGFSFIPIRQAHLDFLSYCYGREAPPINQVVGRAMVDDRFLPLGVALVHFEPCGTNTVHAHFSKWLHVYPKDVLRGMSEITKYLRKHEIYDLHAAADEAIEGSDKLVKWLAGVPTGQRNETGPVYYIDLKKCPI